MAIEEKTFEPQQGRSRATADRLISATVQILDKHGLQGAAIPKIAAIAGVAHGSVYRRFPDKNALLRAACLHVLQRSNEINRTLLKAILLRPTLEETVGSFMSMLMLQYRSHPRLLKAIEQFITEDDNAPFASEARRLLSANVDEIASLLLTFQSQIHREDHRLALRFAILNATTSVRAIVFEPASLWHDLCPGDEDALVTELVRTFVSYLRGSSDTAKINLRSIDQQLRNAVTLMQRSTPAPKPPGLTVVE